MDSSDNKISELAGDLDLDQQATLQAHMKTIIVCEQMRKKVNAFEHELEKALQNFQLHQKTTVETFTKIKTAKDRIINDLNDLTHIVAQNNLELKNITRSLYELSLDINSCKTEHLCKDAQQSQQAQQAQQTQELDATPATPATPKVIYISYSYANNRILTGAEHGWVSTLHYNLNILLRQKLHDDFFKLLANDLSGNAQITPQIISQIESASALVIIYSTAYAYDDKCNLELRTFLSKNKVEDKKIFVVEYDNATKDSELDDLRGYRFWTNGSKIRTIASPIFDSKKDADYHSKLNEMANDIASLLLQS